MLHKSYEIVHFWGEIHLQNISYVCNMFYSGSKYLRYQKKHSLSKKIYILHSFDEKTSFSVSLSLLFYLIEFVVLMEKW